MPLPLSLIATAPMALIMVAKTAFTAGAMAGAAGVIGLIALRQCMKEQKRRDSFEAPASSTSTSGSAADMST